MNKSITQDMAYRQSLMKYAEKYGVSRASRKYNKSRSYIYFWKARWDGTPDSLACQSKLIKPYTPGHNGKVERSHRKDNEYFYALHKFYPFENFAKQLAVHNRRSNNFPMRPLNWRSPAHYLHAYISFWFRFLIL